jgi:hypothetical protein
MSSDGPYAQTAHASANTTTTNTSDYLSIDDSIVTYINKPLDEIQMYQFNDHHHLHHFDTSPTNQHHQSVILIVNEDGTSTIKNIVDSNTCLILNNPEQLTTHTATSASANNLDLLNESSCSSSNSNSTENSAESRQTEQPEQKFRQFVPMSNIVPTMSNVEDIFQLLSQKIAKYCQILTDLTNCEVFYKAQLHVNDPKAAAAPPPKSNSKYKPKNVVNKNVRSLYWGTHQMLFQHSHGDGLKYEKSNGDSLIKIGHRSLSNDINSLIEELLNMNEEPSGSNANGNKPVLPGGEKKLFKSFPAEKSSDDNVCFLPIESVSLKECFIGLERLDDNVFEQYLSKFEVVNNNVENERNMFDVNDLVEECRVENEFEIYSDEFKLDLSRMKASASSQARVRGSATKRKRRKRATDDMVNSSGRDETSQSNNHNSNESDEEDVDEDEEEEDEEEEDLDERTLLERNCFNIGQEAELNENEEDYYSCEYCTGHYYKHLPQLKVNFEGFLRLK